MQTATYIVSLMRTCAKMTLIWVILYSLSWVGAESGYAQADGDQDGAAPTFVRLPAGENNPFSVEPGSLAPEDEDLARRVSVIIFSDSDLDHGGKGSGFFVSSDGWVITDDHVVRMALDPQNAVHLQFGLVYTHPGSKDGLPDSIDVSKFQEGGGVIIDDAKIVSTFFSGDLALVKLELPPEVGPAPYVDKPHPSFASSDAASMERLRHLAIAGTPGGSRSFTVFPAVLDTRRCYEVEIVTGYSDVQVPVPGRGWGTLRIGHLESSVFVGPTRPPATVADWDLLLHGYSGAPSGFSGGPVIVDQALAGLIQRASFGPPKAKPVLHAMPVEFLTALIGFGDPDFSGEQGYRLPEDLQQRVGAGKDPFAERKLAFVETDRGESIDPVRLVHLLGMAFEVATENGQDYDRGIASLVERYGSPGSEHAKLVEYFAEVVTRTDELLLIDDSASGALLGFDGEGKGLDELAEVFMSQFLSNPRVVVAYYASLYRPVVFTVPPLHAKGAGGPSAPEIYARIVEQLFVAAFQFGIQFGEGSPVYFAGNRSRFREALSFTEGPSTVRSSIPTEAQMKRAFALLAAFHRYLGTLGSSEARNAQRELGTLLQRTLSLPSAAPVLKFLAPPREQLVLDEALPELPRELKGALIQIAEGRRDVRVRPLMVRRWVDSGILGAEVRGAELTRAEVRGAILDANAMLEAKGRPAVARSVIPKLEVLLTK